MIREKEAKIVESERVAKDLMLKAGEFEDMFIGEILCAHNYANPRVHLTALSQILYATYVFTSTKALLKKDINLLQL